MLCDMKAALNDGVIENFEMINVRTHLNLNEFNEYEILSKINKRIQILNKDGIDIDSDLLLKGG